jgi:hypothetical protein
VAGAPLPGSGRKLTATGRIRQIRKDIARVHTIRTERELDAATRAAVAANRSTAAAG